MKSNAKQVVRHAAVRQGQNLSQDWARPRWRSRCPAWHGRLAEINVGVCADKRQRAVRHQFPPGAGTGHRRDQRDRRHRKSMGGAKLKLIIADATSQPTTAATVARRLITQNRCVVSSARTPRR